MSAELKRQNFNITPEQDAEIAWLRDSLGAPSAKDVILRAVQVLALLVRESQRGNGLYVGPDQGSKTRIVFPELPASLGTEEPWRYLVARPHQWRRQLYMKGKRLLASTVYGDMVSNKMSPEEAAANWDLPVAAIAEAVRYCQENQALLQLEADEERTRLEERGIKTSAS